jgi:DNA-binding response OmpR family regulator
VQIGELLINRSARSVALNGRPITLLPRALDLLDVLASSPGRVISIDELLTHVWGAGYEGQPQVVYVYMRWLREKIEIDPKRPRRIVTVHRAGYKLVPQEFGATAWFERSQ